MRPTAGAFLVLSGAHCTPRLSVSFSGTNWQSKELKDWTDNEQKEDTEAGERGDGFYEEEEYEEEKK
jgi:hypothetical protein